MSLVSFFKTLFAKKHRNPPRTPPVLEDHGPEKAANNQVMNLSAQSPTNSCSKETSPSSTSKYRIENGRRYHEREDVAYVLPDDDTENDRVHQQHWILKIVSDGNFNSPVEDALERGIKVLDAGCGPGTWTLEMANSYPSSEFHGVDILTRFPETIKPGNCHFHTHNLVDQGFFPDNHFGLIHQRLLVGGLLSKYWETVIEEHVRTLKPGGWLEIMEYNFLKTAERAGPKLAIMCNGLITACDIRGLQGRINEVLEPMLESAGLVNIQIKEDEYPLDQDTQLSKLGWDNVSEAFVALKPIVSRALPELEDDENYTRFTEETKNEARERKSIMYLYRIFGQKPQSCLLE